MTVDAHHHLWRLDRGHYGWITPELEAIRRDFLPPDLAPLLAEAGVRRTVLVQAAPAEQDTDFMLEIADAVPMVGAVVGWTDLRASDAPRRLEARAQRAKFRGVRPMLQDDGDASWIVEGSAAPALEALERLGLSFDALVRTPQLPVVAALADRRPHLPIVVDHAAKPPIASGDLGFWRALIADTARRPNVWCKLSGLLTEAGSQTTDEALAPVVEHLLAVFGPERLMWGSDWPVLNLASGYSDWLAKARRLVPAEAHGAVFEATAARFYRLDGAA